MADIRQVTDDYAVAPQIDEDDFAQIAAAGFKLVLNNRPDGETFGQMPSDTSQKAALAQGMSYAAIPVSGMPSEANIAELIKVLESNPGPVFAYCRSGTRSCVLWSMANVKAGRETPESAIEKARQAGYDLSHLLEMLAQF